MAAPERTQKQIAARFKGNLDYFKKPHYLRRWRWIVSVVVLCLGLAAILAYRQAGGPETFYSSGPLSQAHQHLNDNCAACHEPGSFQAVQFDHVAAIDQNCQQCHTAHSLHQPNVPYQASCTACHKEHVGHGPMLAVADGNCFDCHGDAEQMRIASRLGATLHSDLFDYRPVLGLKVFTPPRPEGGRTNVFNSFADHPEFQFRREGLLEGNTLRFNHERHFAADIPRVDGLRMDCAFCHVPDASRDYHQPVTFEKHCRVCHSMEFDPATPGLAIPHGDPEFVRAFLRSLPVQYAGRLQERGEVAAEELDSVVREKMTGLRERYGSGEELERLVFFSNHATSPAPGNAIDGATISARVVGCAYCHEVHGRGDAVPAIIAPQIPDRWLSRGEFTHARHAHLNCALCHDVATSRETADILLPSLRTCVECHQPAGAAPDACATCHGYHARPDVDRLQEWQRLLRTLSE